MLNEGVTVGVNQRNIRMDKDPTPMPFGGVFSFFAPEPKGSSPPSQRGQPPSPKKTVEDLKKLEELEQENAVIEAYVTPRGETPILTNRAKALTAFFDQFCELSA